MGLIPAHAGKTWRGLLLYRLQGAHPRSRGENVWMPVQTAWIPGSSPLTRGKLLVGRHAHQRGRLIPAHAGKTVSWMLSIRAPRAHPRSRGENFWLHWRHVTRAGSSPLTRGKRRTLMRGPFRRGLIPAHAGKTTTPLPSILSWWAHPRSRGENYEGHRMGALGCGSSPLTRGKRGPRRRP